VDLIFWADFEQRIIAGR